MNMQDRSHLPPAHPGADQKSTSYVRQVQQIGHGDGAGIIQVHSIPLFDRK
jgi:hypothetical protein